MQAAADDEADSMRVCAAAAASVCVRLHSHNGALAAEFPSLIISGLKHKQAAAILADEKVNITFTRMHARTHSHAHILTHCQAGPMFQ